MKSALGFGLLLVGSLVAVACGSGDAAGSSGAAGAAGDDMSNAGAGQIASTDLCHDGCVSTIAAACSNGPADQAGCESQCHALEAGNCGSAYAALQTCGKGKAITCSADGLPTVTGCSDEQAAFVACLNR